MCVCLKYLCRSGSDWPEIFNLAAAWFKGEQCWICLNYNDTVNKWFHKWFTNSASTVNHRHHVRTRANHCWAHPHALPPELTDMPARPLEDDVAARRSLLESRFWLMCWWGLQTIYQFLNCVDRPSKTGPMINNEHHAFSLTLPWRLLCVWCRKKR